MLRLKLERLNVRIYCRWFADKDDAIIVKQFLKEKTDVIEANKYEVDYLVKVSGEINDTFIKDVVIMLLIETIEKIDKKVRRDTAKKNE